MGHYLRPGDEFNPKGYYEDLISHGLIYRMVAGDNSVYSPEMYLSIMNGLHKDCFSWGVKDPWFLYLPRRYLAEIKPKLCVIADRSLEGTVGSWIRLWQSRELSKEKPEPPKSVVDHYTRLTLERQRLATNLRGIWPNSVTIDFTERVEEKEIISAIRNGLSSANQR
jgi:hypothetical protein